MTNTQLFIALLASFLTVAAAQIGMLKWHVDARFSAIDNQLRFLIDHAVSHAERIAALEARRQQ